MRRIYPFLIAFVLISLLILTTANVQTKSIDNALDNFLEDEAFEHASIGFMAKDITANKTLSFHNEKLSITPASTLKIVSTASALEMLGANHQFKTQIAYSGTIDTNGTLQGNIYIIGGGDPVLGSKYFKEDYYKPNFADKWVQEIKKAGIKSVNGQIIGDATFFNSTNIPNTWIWEDISNYYGAAPNGLMVFENYYKIIFKSPNKHLAPTQIIGIEPSIVNIDITNEVLSSNKNKDNAYIYGSPFSNKRIIQGTIPKNKKSFKIKGALSNSPLLAAKLLHQKLIQSGVSARGTFASRKKEDSIPSHKIIHTTSSPILADIVKRANKKSINLIAESCLYHAAISTDTCKNTNEATTIITNYWKKKGMDDSGFFIYDGCGLSKYNAITASNLVFVLEYMKNKSTNFEAFYNSLPIAGVDGTMRYMCRKSFAEGNARAKSGTMTNVKSYAGYLKTRSDRNIAFAILINNFDCTQKEITHKIAKLITDIADSTE